MILSSQYLVQTVWFQLREWRKNGLEVLKLNISKGPVSRPPLSGSDCLNLVLDFGTTLERERNAPFFLYLCNYTMVFLAIGIRWIRAETAMARR